MVDLGNGAAMATFEHAAAPYLVATADRRYAFAAQYEADQVEVIDARAQPRKLDVVLRGGDPSHLVERDGKLGVFFDADGRAEIIEISQLGAGPPRPVVLTGLGRQHGVSLAFGANYLVTLPGATQDDLPVGVALKNAGGATLAESRACPKVHGESVVGDTALLACDDGIMVASPDGAGARFQKIAYPPGAPGPDGDRRTYGLLPDPSRNIVVGQLTNRNELVRLDLTTRMMTTAALPANSTAMEIVPAAGGAVLTVANDGTLHKLDPANGAVLASVKVTDPFSTEGDDPPPAPEIEALGTQVFVSDPAKGTVTELNGDALTVTRTIQVGGKPTGMVLLGGP